MKSDDIKYIISVISMIISVLIFFFLSNGINHLNQKDIFIGVSLIIAVIEEFYFRLLIIGEIKTIGVSVIFLSAVSYGVCHIVFSKKDIVVKSILGLLLSTVYYLTQNIELTVCMHCIYNLLLPLTRPKVREY